MDGLILGIDKKRCILLFSYKSVNLLKMNMKMIFKSITTWKKKKEKKYMHKEKNKVINIFFFIYMKLLQLI